MNSERLRNETQMNFRFWHLVKSFSWRFFSCFLRNQEIRDAILSLVHSNSLLDAKLERHETRERALGELVKKGLMTLQKNQRIFEPIKGSFDRLDKRVSEIETMLLNVSASSTADADEFTRISSADRKTEARRTIKVNKLAREDFISLREFRANIVSCLGRIRRRRRREAGEEDWRVGGSREGIAEGNCRGESWSRWV